MIRLGISKFVADCIEGQYVAISVAPIDETILPTDREPLPLVAIYVVDRENFRLLLVR